MNNSLQVLHEQAKQYKINLPAGFLRIVDLRDEIEMACDVSEIYDRLDEYGLDRSSLTLSDEIVEQAFSIL